MGTINAPRVYSLGSTAFLERREWDGSSMVSVFDSESTSPTDLPILQLLRGDSSFFTLLRVSQQKLESYCSFLQKLVTGTNY